jgi:hypothetical protein
MSRWLMTCILSARMHVAKVTCSVLGQGRWPTHGPPEQWMFAQLRSLNFDSWRDGIGTSVQLIIHTVTVSRYFRNLHVISCDNWYA